MAQRQPRVVAEQPVAVGLVDGMDDAIGPAHDEGILARAQVSARSGLQLHPRERTRRPSGASVPPSLLPEVCVGGLHRPSQHPIYDAIDYMTSESEHRPAKSRIMAAKMAMRSG